MTIIDLINSPEINLPGAIFKLALSLVLGAAVGIERKRKGQVAGMRTFALISMGATLAMLVSIYIPQEYMGLKNGDPGRIAAQVISGIGFLGAGAIIQMKASVRGLTTAAGIWITASIGLAVGAGMYVIATVAALLIMFIYIQLDQYEHKISISWETKIIRIKVASIVGDILPYRTLLQNYQIHISDEFIKYDYEQPQTIINFITLTRKGRTDFVRLFDEIHQLDHIKSITLTNEVNN